MFGALAEHTLFPQASNVLIFEQPVAVGEAFSAFSDMNLTDALFVGIFPDDDRSQS
jgi:hypothetical protein